MRSISLRQAVLVAALTGLSAAQESDVIPQDLQSGFNTELQVSYTGEANNGFKDGSQFSKDEVAEKPSFALGDSSGISSQRRYTILMVDTTCEGARTLHFARANYKVNFDGVKIASETDPVLAYQAPGSLGEQGDGRQYSFLMYTQPPGQELSDLQVPAEGEAFDATKFQSDNGFKDPAAGVGMLVDLGGQSNCGNGGGGGGGDRPQSSSPPEAPSSSPAQEEPQQTQAPTPSRAPSTPTPAPQPTSEDTPEPSQAPESPAATPSEAPEAPASSAPAATSAPAQSSAAPSQQPSETAEEEVPSTEAPESEAPATTEAPSTIVSTIVDNGTPSTLLTSAGTNDTIPGSETTTGGPVLQTTNDGNGLRMGLASFGVTIAAVVFAGLLAW